MKEALDTYDVKSDEVQAFVNAIANVEEFVDKEWRGWTAAEKSFMVKLLECIRDTNIAPLTKKTVSQVGKGAKIPKEITHHCVDALLEKIGQSTVDDKSESTGEALHMGHLAVFKLLRTVVPHEQGQEAREVEQTIRVLEEENQLLHDQLDCWQKRVEDLEWIIENLRSDIKALRILKRNAGEGRVEIRSEVIIITGIISERRYPNGRIQWLISKEIAERQVLYVVAYVSLKGRVLQEGMKVKLRCNVAKTPLWWNEEEEAYLADLVCVLS